MSYVISLNEIQDGEKFGEIYVKGDYYTHGGKLLLFKGESCNYEDRALFNRIIQEGIYIVPKVKGEFFMIYYNENLRKIYIANDRLGRETLFYFYNKKNFILSDDFWEIVNLIQPIASNIDKQSAKEFVMFYNPLFYKTIIKDLNFFPPANIGEFSLNKQTFSLNQYWDFRLQPNKELNFEEAAERFDNDLENAMKQIKEKNSTSATYGVGLSGGLDSRLIPYYALKHNMNLKSFIIGEKSPHKFLLSNDHKRARELAKYYKLNHREVEYDSESFENKSFYDLRYFPMGGSNFFISIRKNIPAFDILLTGASGYLVGAAIPGNAYNDKLSDEDLVNLIVENLSLIKSHNKYEKLRIAFNLIFGCCKQSKKKLRQSIKGIINKDEFAKAVNKIYQFVNTEHNSGKSNFEIYLKYFHHLGAKNKYGVFESLNGYKKSYSIYYPYLLDDILSWKPEFFKNRALLKYLIIKKHPGLSKIREPNYKPPFLYKYKNKKGTLFRKMFVSILYIVIYIIRGEGVWARERWANKQEYKEKFKEILLRHNTMFESMFDADDIIKLSKSGKISFAMYTQIVKLKQIFDLIETGNYKKLIENNINGQKG